MLKFLLILIILSYVLFKVIGFVFRTIFVTSSHFQNRENINRNESRSERKAPDSNLNIDYVPKEERQKNGKANGGDYIDYEELD